MAATAPGQAGATLRRTSVRRRPYWMPWGNDGKGRVKLLPADRTHNVAFVDENGISEPYYQSKKFVPINLLPDDHEAHKVFRQMCVNARKRAKAEHLPVPDWVTPE